MSGPVSTPIVRGATTQPPVPTRERALARSVSTVMLILCLLWQPALAAAQSAPPWQTVITGNSATPPYLIAVDKSRQQMSFFERRSPLRQSRLFYCTTGQAVGDKRVEGDLKTPEGIYFVVQRIGYGLDFLKYGNEAYTLNYPNPVDRLRRKTGHGIWIHGRGETLVPLQTEGCVAMDNGDLALLGRLLVPGTPVALTESFAFAAEEDPKQAATAELLRDKVRAWAEAWSARSHAYFDFYDPKSYSLAQGESFSAFRAQKERLFKQLPWIKTSVRDVQALPGPGYWVTWFYQDYQAPNLSTRGVRRLYWAEDGSGDFKILGMEWHPGMNTSSTLLADAGPLLPPLSADELGPRPGWQAADGPNGVYGVIAASRGDLPPRLSASARGAMGVPLETAALGQEVSATVSSEAGAIPARDARAATSDRQATAGPATLTADTARAAGPESAGSHAARPATARAEAGKKPGQPGPDHTPMDSVPRDHVPLDHVEDASSPAMARPSEEAFRLAAQEADRLEALRRTEAAQTARAVPASDPRPAAIAAATGISLPPPLPAQGLSPTPAASAGKGETPPDRSRQTGSGQIAPGQTASTQTVSAASPLAPGRPAGETQGAGAPSLLAVGPAAQAAPEQAPAPVTLGEEGARSRSGADARAAVAGIKEAELAEAKETQARIKLVDTIESWRQSWEKGDLEGYMRHYASNSSQGSRKSADAIKRQKRDLWKRSRPALVSLEGIKLVVTGTTARAEMRQVYKDANNNGDVGLKRLTLVFKDGAWLITQEEWSALADETGD